jgi:glycosyltransferase involved in cell wall biosynthesis
MKTLLLFDAETQHYRQSIYKYFREEFAKHGYRLKVVYDKQLNRISNSPNDDLFLGIHYTFKNFTTLINENQSSLIIMFVWLRYKFLLPFMLYQRIKGTKIITWSHGINLQKKDNRLMNLLYYLRQILAHALIIFSENEKPFIKASHKKVFVANNTLNFNDFPVISLSKEQLKEQYLLAGKKIVLCVGRMNTNNRKVDYLLEGFEKYPPPKTVLLIVGPGLTAEQEARVKKTDNIQYFGAIYDPIKINEIYKLSDIFCMPGAIGLAVNHAFYYRIPVVVEDVDQGPEAIYLKTGQNGYLFKKGDIEDMMDKIVTLLEDKNLYESFSKQAEETIKKEASVEKMLAGFLEAINYVRG